MLHTSVLDAASADNVLLTLAAMKAARRWLLASPGKVPHYVDGTPRRGSLDTPDDTARLASYDEAKSALQHRVSGWYLGFALGPDGEGGHWQGVDLDKIEENQITGLVDPLPGYVEWSPSGKGVHAIGYGRHFRSLGSNGSGIEAYAAGRFFTFTARAARDGNMVCLADHVEQELARHHNVLSKKAWSDRMSTAGEAVPIVQVSAQTVGDIRSALNHVRADGYGLWIEIGHALKTLGDTGRGLWLDWSATSPKYDPQLAAEKWEGFDPRHTSYRMVFVLAKERGWSNPAVNVVGNASVFAQFAEGTSSVGVMASPFIMPDFFDIPPRPWVLGYWLLRGTLTTVIAPGGTGKSALMVAMALSLATGRELLGKTVWNGPQHVWLWNLEDDRDELSRQFAACSLHHRISEHEHVGRLFVDDAASSLCTATKNRDGLEVHEPVNAAIIAEIRARNIDVLIVDPFVSSHRAEENDNGQMDAIAKAWASVARQANCAIVLVHHSRKLGGQNVDAESSRGASAVTNAARSVLVLNRMEGKEASGFGIAAEDRRRFFRVSNDKSNRALAGEANWFHLASVRLANGGPLGGDSLGVVERWTPPDFTPIYGNDLRAKIQAEISSDQWRSSISAKGWVGIAIAKIIGANLDDPASKQRVKILFNDMLTKGQLRIEQRKDRNRKLRDFVVVGEPIKDFCASPAC